MVRLIQSMVLHSTTHIEKKKMNSFLNDIALYFPHINFRGGLISLAIVVHGSMLVASFYSALDEAVTLILKYLIPWCMSNSVGT